MSGPSNLWAVKLSKTEDAEPKSVSEMMSTIGGFSAPSGIAGLLEPEGAVAARYRWRESLKAARPDEFRLRIVGNSSIRIIRRWDDAESWFPPASEVLSAPSSSSPLNLSPRPRNSSN